MCPNLPKPSSFPSFSPRLSPALPVGYFYAYLALYRQLAGHHRAALRFADFERFALRRRPPASRGAVRPPGGLRRPKLNFPPFFLFHFGLKMTFYQADTGALLSFSLPMCYRPHVP